MSDTIIPIKPVSQHEIYQLLTPQRIEEWISFYHKRIYPPMIEDELCRCVILLYGSTASLTRKLKGSQNDEPSDIIHMSLPEARRKFPNKEQLKISPKDNIFTVIIATYLPLKMLGNDDDGMYTFSMTNHPLEISYKTGDLREVQA